MNFKYDDLKKYLSNELYNTYIMQLDALKLKHGQNIMENITLIDSGVLTINLKGNREEVRMMLEIEMKDYVIDTKTNKVTRGDNRVTNHIKYEITLERIVDSKGVKFCPNCGAELKKGGTERCSYCASIIVNNSEEFVMTKKENVGQYTKR
jgi:hypothetical protein